MKKYFLLSPITLLFAFLWINKACAQNVQYEENFSKYKVGTSPTSIKTNSIGIISIPNGFPGKWLLLQDKATYKFSKPIIYPENFTFEFDLLATAEQTKEISPVSFGFAKDNSTSEYISNIGAFVELHYYDGNAVNVGNYAQDKFINTTFDLTNTINRVMSIKLIVKGNNLSLYLDKKKIADTTLFKSGNSKYFYITAPWEYNNGAKVFVSNFRIEGFKN